MPHTSPLAQAPPALVFNCHYNGLAIIQELGRRGIPVYALDNKRSVGTYSRYGKFLRCPNPESNEREFIDYLLDLGKTLPEKAVLFPTNDHWAAAIAKHRDLLSEYYLPSVAPEFVVDLVIQKQRFYEWALEREFPVPRSWSHKNLSNIPPDAYPLAAKPEFRRTSGNDAEIIQRGKFLDGKRLTILRSPEDLETFSAEVGDYLPYFIFQEYVEGISDSMYTVGIYANRNSEVLGVFTGRKVRGFPPDVGDCIVGQCEPVPTELIAMVKKLCREIGYQGIAEFEFKRDTTTGEFKLIEINPRSWSWVGITPYCGVSLPWMAYCDLTGHAPVHYTESSLPTGAVKFVKLLPDFWNCMVANKKAGYPQWNFSLRQWWRSLRADKLVIAEFTRDDLRPGFHALRKFLQFVRANLKSGGIKGRKKLFRSRISA